LDNDITIVNTHLNNSKYSKRQILELLNHCNENKIILCGDLNTNQISLFKKYGFQDCTSHLGFTFRNENPLVPFYIQSKIIDYIFYKNVFIIFNNVDQSVKENIGELISDFWLQLIQRISEPRNGGSPFKLLLFFLDYQGFVINWNIGFADSYGSDWQQNIPLALPNILPFSPEELQDWLNQQSDDLENLPGNIAVDKESTLQVLLEKKGIPEPTFRKICDLCGFNWFEQEDKWQPL
jgi:hypothetical protein